MLRIDFNLMGKRDKVCSISEVRERVPDERHR